MGKLDGKVAIVTGAARGQGEAEAKLLAEEGAKVIVTDFRVELGEAVAKEIGESAKFVKLDVTKAEDWKNVVEEAESTFGPVDILVNNAGISVVKFIADTTEEEFKRMVDVNLTGQFLGIKAVLPSMKKTGSGSIINCSSTLGLLASPGTTAYTASKFGSTGLTKAAALDLAPFGIRVNSIHPGVIDTPILTDGADKDDRTAGVKAASDATPLGRIGRPEEAAKLVLFLATDATFCTGSEFVFDGGITCSL